MDGPSPPRPESITARLPPSLLFSFLVCLFLTPIMRLSFALILVFLSSLAAVCAWTKEDYEIFDLVSDLEAAEGKGTTFYSHLNVGPGATTQQITKAYRKKSLELHPDKNIGVKDIEKRFARLGVIAQILRSPEQRERYNFFYKNGVPRWRGTGYYYTRFRPTLFHTLLFLVLLTNLFHRLVLSLNYNKHLRRIAYFENAAKSAAGVLGPGGVGAQNEKIALNANMAQPGRRRKVKVPMVEGNESVGTLELIVSGNEVYLPHEGGTLTPISSLARPPSFAQTWFPSLLLSSARRLAANLPSNIQSSLPAILRSLDEESVIVESNSEEDDEEGFALDTPTLVRHTSRKVLQKSRNARSVSKDSPAVSELESDADFLERTSNGKKKKSGPGKASAMRKRKMALKK